MTPELITRPDPISTLLEMRDRYERELSAINAAIMLFNTSTPAPAPIPAPTPVPAPLPASVVSFTYDPTNQYLKITYRGQSIAGYCRSDTGAPVNINQTGNTLQFTCPGASYIYISPMPLPGPPADGSKPAPIAVDGQAGPGILAYAWGAK